MRSPGEGEGEGEGERRLPGRAATRPSRSITALKVPELRRSVHQRCKRAGGRGAEGGGAWVCRYRDQEAHGGSGKDSTCTARESLKRRTCLWVAVLSEV